MSKFPKSDSTTLPKWTLSQFRLPNFEQAEAFFAQRYLSIVANSAAGQPIAVAREQIATANEIVARGRFAYGSANFENEVSRDTSLPYLLWLSLSIKHPITQDEAEALIEEENKNEIKGAVLTMMKYETRKNVQTPALKKPATTDMTQSGGESSTEPSEPADSPPNPLND